MKETSNVFGGAKNCRSFLKNGMVFSLDCNNGFIVAKIQNPPPLVRISQMSRLGNGSLQLSYSNMYGGDAYSVYGSSNLFNWSPLGRATQAAPGLFQFTDTQASQNNRRFYQLRWP